MRRFGRVLLIVAQPIRPSSDLAGAVQLVVTVAGPIVTPLLVFLFVPGSMVWIIVAVLGMLLVLSLRGAYRIQADKEALLSGTPLQNHLANEIREGTELLHRIKRLRSPQVWTDLERDIIAWAGSAITDTASLAPELAAPLLEAHATGPGSRDRKQQQEYVQGLLHELRKLGRDLR